MHRPKSHLTSTIYAYIDASGRFIFCIFKSYSGFYCAQPYDLSIPINSRLIMTVPLWFGDMDSPQFATLQLYRTYCNCGEGLSRDTVRTLLKIHVNVKSCRLICLIKQIIVMQAWISEYEGFYLVKKFKQILCTLFYLLTNKF